LSTSIPSTAHVQIQQQAIGRVVQHIGQRLSAASAHAHEMAALAKKSATGSTVSGWSSTIRIDAIDHL